MRVRSIGSESSESQEIQSSQEKSSQTSNWSETSESEIDKEKCDRLAKKVKLESIFEKLNIGHPSCLLSPVDLSRSLRYLKPQAQAVYGVFMEILDLLIFDCEISQKVFIFVFLYFLVSSPILSWTESVHVLGSGDCLGRICGGKGICQWHLDYQ